MAQLTIGVGGDCSDIGTAWQTMLLASPYVWPSYSIQENWEFLIISNFTEAVGRNNFSPDLFGLEDFSPFFNSFTVTIINPAGYVCTCANTNAGNGGLHFLDRSCNGTMIFDGLIFNMNNPFAANHFTFLFFCSGSQFQKVTSFIKNVKAFGSGTTNTIAAPSFISNNSGSLLFCDLYVNNLIVHNYGRAFLGRIWDAGSNVVVLENCNFYGNWRGVEIQVGTAAGLTIKNTVAHDSRDIDWHSLSAGVAINCADSDGSLLTSGGTLVDCKHNIIPADEFESLVSTSDDFLKLKLIDAYVRISGIPRRGPAPLKVKFNNNIEYSVAGKILPAGGIVPTLETKDLAGNLYGEFGFYPIGCYNAEANPLRDVWET